MNYLANVLAALVTYLLVAAPAFVEASMWASVGPDGGAVRSLVFDPANPNVLYAGSPYGGGVFKSTDGGVKWFRASQGIDVPYVTSLALRPGDANVIYAGTDGGGALYRSLDGGLTWASTNPLFGSASLVVRAILIDPSAPDTLFAGTDLGVFKSTDAGGGWEQLIDPGFSAPFNEAFALAIESGVLYAGTETGLFKRTPVGLEWEDANGGESGPPEVLALARDPANSETLLVGTNGDGLFEVTGGGLSWQPLAEDVFNVSGVGDIHSVVFAPDDPTSVYVGTYGQGVFKSSDRGATWLPASVGLGSSLILTLTVRSGTPHTVYAGSEDGVFATTDGALTWSALNSGLTNLVVNALAASPGARYAGTDRGLFRTTDGGASWSSLGGGYGGPRDFRYVLAMAVDPVTPTTLYVSIIHDGVFKSTNGGLDWTPVNQGLSDRIILALAIDPQDPSTVYAGGQNSGVWKSANGGNIWVPIDLGPTPIRVSTMAIDPSGTLYAGTLEGVFRIPNPGPIVGPLGGNLDVSTYSLAIDPSMPSTLYAGTSAQIFKTTNGGVDWANVSDGIGAFLSIQALAIDPSSPSTVYAATAGLPIANGAGVYRTTDGGSSWALANDGLLNHSSVLALAFAGDEPGVVHAGTEGGGVFRLEQLPATHESVSVPIGPGGSCSTDTDGVGGAPDGTTADDPIETTIFTPNAGLCAIDERPAAGSVLKGYSLLGYAVTLAAPPASSVNDPLRIVFELDATLMEGRTAYELQLLKDDKPVPRCVVLNQADPNPCFWPQALSKGGARLIVNTTTASVWSPAVATLDSYLCYGATATKGTPPPAAASGHLFTDALASTRFDLVKPGALCLPAARNGAAITDGTTALQTAALKAGKVCSDTGLACTKKQDCAAPATCGKQAKFTARTGITVLNALGAHVVDATKPATALVPSATSASLPPGVPNPALDTFTCYATKPRAKVCAGNPTRACAADAECGDAAPCFLGVPKDLTVRLDEPVATAGGKVFAVKKPTQLCLPAEVDDTPRQVPGVSLQCYAIVPAKKQCANTALINAGASCKQEEDCGGLKNATSFCQAQAKHAPNAGFAVTSEMLGALQRDTKKETEVCVPSAAVVR